MLSSKVALIIVSPGLLLAGSLHESTILYHVHSCRGGQRRETIVQMIFVPALSTKNPFDLMIICTNTPSPNASRNGLDWEPVWWRVRG